MIMFRNDSVRALVSRFYFYVLEKYNCSAFLETSLDFVWSYGVKISTSLHALILAKLKIVVAVIWE